jgi:predicted DNA-binding ArsR family transcriptional regulator
MRWEELVTDPLERKVFAALDAPSSTWRTLPAIAREAGLDESRVSQILDKYDLKLTRRSEEQSISRHPLFGLIENVGV